MNSLIFKKIQLKIKNKIFNVISFKKYKMKYISSFDQDLTIISNNCFAGNIYQIAGVKYNTPTVGLFFHSQCYSKFVSNLNHYLRKDLKFIEFSRYFSENPSYPIGLLDDIEIHFLHYSSRFEAEMKWNLRKQRVNFEKLLFVFSTVDGFNDDSFIFFRNFSGKKILFTSKKRFYEKENSIFVDYRKEDGFLEDITTNKWMFLKNIEYQNKGELLLFKKKEK